MRRMIVLAAIPVATVSVGYALTPSSTPIVATPVTTESIHAQRIDTGTFRRRWSPVTDMPPTSVIEPLVLTANAVPTQRRVRAKPVRLRLTVCAHHGMRKQTYYRRGWKYWRCRR